MKAEPTQTSRLTEIAGTLESASVLLFYLKKIIHEAFGIS